MLFPETSMSVQAHPRSHMASALAIHESVYLNMENYSFEILVHILMAFLLLPR